MIIKSVDELEENIKYGYCEISSESTQKYIYKKNNNVYLIEYNYRRYGYDDKETLNIFFEFRKYDNMLKLNKFEINHDNLYGGGIPYVNFNGNPNYEFIFKYEIIGNYLYIDFLNFVKSNDYNFIEISNLINKIKLGIGYINKINLKKIDI